MATAYEAREVTFGRRAVIGGNVAVLASVPGGDSVDADLPIALDPATIVPVWFFTMPGAGIPPRVDHTTPYAAKKVTFTFQGVAHDAGTLHWQVAGEPA